MRVAVLGSWHDKRKWPLRETPEAFAAACRSIGRALASRGHSLIVGSDGEHTADFHATLGALDVIREAGRSPQSPRVLVVRAARSAAPGAFEPLRRSDPGVFTEQPVSAGSQAVVKLVQTKLADAVMLVGGAEHTEQAGLAAAVGGKPLACIGSFGGAAFALNQRFADAPGLWGFEARQGIALRALQEPFGEGLMLAALRLAWIEGAPKLMVIHGRSADRNLLKRHLLQKVGQVIVLTDEFAPTEPIPLKFERYASSVDGAIALLTPDDVGGLALEAPSAAPRARENVWVEVGWFWGRRGRGKLLLLKKGNVTIPSDLGNVEHYGYDADPTERMTEIDRFLDRLRSASDVNADD
jgi:hypothetical protein